MFFFVFSVMDPFKFSSVVEEREGRFWHQVQGHDIQIRDYVMEQIYASLLGQDPPRAEPRITPIWDLTDKIDPAPISDFPQK